MHMYTHADTCNRCAQAAVYTDSFCEAIVEGFKKHARKHKIKLSKQLSSLKARDDCDNPANYLEIGANDSEYDLDIGEIMELNLNDHSRCP